MSSTMHSMPGSFMFQHDHNCATLDSIFQPPAYSPSPANRSSQTPRPVSRSSKQAFVRKRPRLNTNASYFSRPVNQRSTTSTSTPFTPDGSYDNITHASALSSSNYSLGDENLLSPSPLANSDYRLAGGLDTPSASLEQGLDELARDEAERDYRINRYTTTNTSRTSMSISTHTGNSVSHDGLPRTPGADSLTSNARERKRPRTYSQSTAISGSLTGWGIRSTAWALTGGLAGRVFNFCLNTAFRGFGAGGGDSYHFDFDTSGANTTHSYMKDDIFGSNHQNIGEVPGGFPHDLSGFVDDYMKDSIMRNRQSEFTPTSGQSRWDADAGEQLALRGDWQIVDQVNVADSGDEPSPARKRSRASVAGCSQRSGHHTSVSTAGGRAPPAGASYASPRSRSSMGFASNQIQRAISNTPSSAVRRSRPSLGGLRRSQSSFVGVNTTSTGTTSPERPSSSRRLNSQSDETALENGCASQGVSPEVVNYRRKMKQREKAEDENLRRLNAQLRDMIRQGREALGSKIEVLDDENVDMVDEGFYESEWV